MAYLQTITPNSADRTGAKRNNERMPYYLAIPIWITLAVVAWSPLILLFRAIAA